MRNYTTYVGMDVHARSIQASAVDVTTGEVYSRSFAGCPTAADVAEWLATLPQPVYCAEHRGQFYVLGPDKGPLSWDKVRGVIGRLPQTKNQKALMKQAGNRQGDR